MALGAGGTRAQPAIDVFGGLSDALLRIIGWILWIAPVGVFLLVAWTVGRIGLESVSGSMSKFMLLTIGGLAVHGLIVLPLILLMLGHANPMRFMWQSRKALLMGFGTASKSATMPVTLQTCIDEAGCSRRAADFVIPLGAAINRNGTALFEAIAVVFLCQLYDIDLQFGELLVIVITSTVAAIAAAGIPAAGLVTMVIVINAVNLSLDSRGVHQLPESAIGIIAGVDRILDMCRTTVNVWADMVGAKVMTRLAPDPTPIVTTVA
jgi:Na+/H+-dicarboxylate symporter